MTQRLFPVFGLGAAALVLAALAVTPARADDQEKMQGKWDATHAQIGKEEATPAQLEKIHVTVEGNKLILEEGDKVYTVHFGLNPGAKPSAIDFYKASDLKVKSGLGSTISKVRNSSFVGRRSGTIGRPSLEATSITRTATSC
jgi:uncharacterized protein (TIGR03067 family)